jgi:translation elongation factor EF-1beta
MVNVPDDTEVSDLPFTHARVKRMVREKAEEGQYVRSDVYFGLNILLGEIADEIIDNMMDTHSAYVEKHDLDNASRKYERVENIIKEKERVSRKLDGLAADIERMSRQVDQADE